jgi:PAS domain S-box-containing protein
VSVHLGLLALMIAVAGIGLLRFRRGRRLRALFLPALAAAVVIVEIALWSRETALQRRWEEIAATELQSRSERIVRFLITRGSDALDTIREIAADRDTRALLSDEIQLAKIARHPVFLDLAERVRRGVGGGVTVYDRKGAPRAWAGRPPTATMQPSRRPSGTAEVLRIRQGNIHTLLEAIHPVRSEREDVLGYVVYQEPLRVRFPLENRALEGRDILSDLEGGGGVRADVALELAVGGIEAIHDHRAGPPKLSIGEDVASCTASIVSGDGTPVGRVSLTGLSREGLLATDLAGTRQVRVLLLLAVFLLTLVGLWFGAPKIRPVRLLPGGTLPLVIRIGIVILARGALLRWQPEKTVDPLLLFDPRLYASMRYGGLAGSPGDLVLTAVALLLIGREVRRTLIVHEESIHRLARRLPAVTVPGGLVAALLVGSVVGLLWNRVLDIARSANSQLYGGLDPLSSAPVAILELALLAGGVAFLLWGDVLVHASLALLARLPVRLRAATVAALAIFGSAVKIESASGPGPSGALRRGAGSLTSAPEPGARERLLEAFEPVIEFSGDLLPAIPALLALLVFHWIARRWRRPGAGAILVTSLLAAATVFLPVREGYEVRRRELVELFAHERNQSPSNDRQILLESALDHIVRAPELRDALRDAPRPEHANLAFIVWARSPLVGDPSGCLLRIVGPEGRTFSTFSWEFPPELRATSFGPAGFSGRAPPPFRREELGDERIDVYSRRQPVLRGGRRLGSVEISLAYTDDFRRWRTVDRRFASVFTNLSPTPDFLQLWRDVPDRIDRYRGEFLVASTDPEGALGKRVRPTIVQLLSGPEVRGRWEQGRFGGKVYDLYHVRERDGDRTVGYLSFGIERHGGLHALSLFARSALVSLVLAVGVVLALMLTAPIALDSGPSRLRLPRIGFRERVIGGFLLVSLLPTVLLGVAGRRLFVQEKRREYQERLEEDLRLSREILGRRLYDAARNAVGSDEVVAALRDPGNFRSLSTPASVDGIVVVSADGQLIGASREAALDMAFLPGKVPPDETPVEFFRRRGRDLYTCALVAVPATEDVPGGSVLAFQRIDAALASELERRAGSSISFFTAGLLTATSKPELYQAEILSDLVDSEVYREIELEGTRREVLETRVGSTSFLSGYAPLLDEEREPVGILATLAPFADEGLDPDAYLVLSRIYFLCLLVFTAAIAAALVLANRLTRPLSELATGARRIGEGRFGHRIQTKAPAEIGALVRSFNRMSDRLAASEARDRERREYIEAIIRHVASGVVSLDAGGRVATVNEAAERILGLDAAAVTGALPETVTGSPAFHAVMRAVRPVLEGRREEVVHEIEATATEGVSEGTAGDADDTGDEGGRGEDDREREPERRTIRLIGTPLFDREGRPQGAVVVFEDLTDLIKSEKIKAWAQMARQVAHEIKNPLTPMKLSAQHLRQAWRDRHPKFDRILEESTETIVDRCEALRRIAIEFSDYARMPGRRVRREDLGSLLREARRLYGEAEDRRVGFSLDAPEGRLWTRIDKDEVMRLFINLFENSIQAMPDGGDLKVRAFRDDGHNRVTIADSGVGIPQENLARIFEPSFSTKTGGAGLGLPICKAIMEDYGGTICLRSEVGQGTTVTLEFPVDDV